MKTIVTFKEVADCKDNNEFQILLKSKGLNISYLDYSKFVKTKDGFTWETQNEGK